MHRFFSPWLSRALTIQERLSPQRTQVRHYKYKQWPKPTRRIPMRDKFTTFEASNLVLDLDAEDSKHVRPFNADDDGEPVHEAVVKAHSNMPLLARIAEFERVSLIHQENFAVVKNEPFHPWRLSDLDLIFIALSGLPPNADIPRTGDSSETANEPPPPPQTLTETLLDWNGVPHSARGSVRKTLAYMRRRQDVLENSKFQPPANSNSFLDSLERCRSFTELERVVMTQVPSSAGLGFVVEHSHVIARQCQLLHEQDPAVQPTEMLGFLNDLAVNFASCGLLLPPTFEKIALRFALECGNFVAAQRYVNACFSDSPRSHSVGSRLEVLRATLNSLDRLQQQAAPPPDVTRRRLDIYSFLTGWRFGDDTARPSMRLYYRKDYQTHLLYLTCLARLGAFRTMWYEWHDCLDNESGPATINPDSNDMERYEAAGTIPGDKQWLHTDGPEDDSWKTWALGVMTRLYTEAILETREAGRPASELLECVDFTDASGNRRDDCQLDMKTIIKLEEMRPPEPSTAAGTQGPSIAERKYDKEIETIFNKDDISEALAGLQKLFEEVATTS